MKDRIAKSVFWLVWSKGGLQLLSGLSTIVVARWLDPQDYGLMAMAGVWITTASLLAELGLGTAIIQFRGLEQGELNACFWLILTIGSVGYGILFLSAPIISQWLLTPALMDILRVVGLSLPLLAVAVVPDSLLRQRLAFEKISQAQIVSSIATISVVLSMAWGGAGVWALVAGAIVQPFINGILVFWFVRWLPSLRIAGNKVGAILRYSLATLGSRFCWTVYSQIDALILGKLAGDVSLGFYAMGKELALLPVTKISVIINQLAFPVMAELQEDIGRLKAVLVRGIRLSSTICFPMCFGMALIAEDLFSLALGQKWLPAVPLFKIFCIYAVIKSIDVLFPPVLQARYRPYFLLGYTLMLLLVMTIAFIPAGYWWGNLGMALVWIVVYPLTVLVLAHQVLKECHLPWTALFNEFKAPLLLSLTMALAVTGFQGLVPAGNPIQAFVRLGGAIVIGALLYGGGLFLIGGKIVDELKEILSWIFSRSGINPRYL